MSPEPPKIVSSSPDSTAVKPPEPANTPAPEPLDVTASAPVPPPTLLAVPVSSTLVPPEPPNTTPLEPAKVTAPDAVKPNCAPVEAAVATPVNTPEVPAKSVSSAPAKVTAAKPDVRPTTSDWPLAKIEEKPVPPKMVPVAPVIDSTLSPEPPVIVWFTPAAVIVSLPLLPTADAPVSAADRLMTLLAPAVLALMSPTTISPGSLIVIGAPVPSTVVVAEPFSVTGELVPSITTQPSRLV